MLRNRVLLYPAVRVSGGLIPYPFCPLFVCFFIYLFSSGTDRLQRLFGLFGTKSEFFHLNTIHVELAVASSQ